MIQSSRLGYLKNEFVGSADTGLGVVLRFELNTSKVRTKKDLRMMVLKIETAQIHY